MRTKRRNDQRVAVSQLIMQVQGACAAGPFYGMVGDLSVKGGFFLTYAGVQIKEVVSAQILLPTERWLYVKGEVTHRIERVGFGVRFLSLTEEEKALLELVVEYAQGLSVNIDADTAGQAGTGADGAYPAERRRYPRAEIAGDSRAQEKAAATSIEDISMGGLFLRTAASVQPGQTLTLRLSFGAGAPLVVSVEVVYIRPGHGAGLRFLWQGENDPARARLAREIAAQAGQE